MRKLSALVVVACLCYVVASADAGTSKFRGEIDPSGRLSFMLEKKAGKRRVVKLKWTNLPVTCKGKRRKTTGGLTFKVRVKGGSFATSAVSGDPDDPDASAEISGKVGRRRASGKIKVSGGKLALTNDKDGNCRSGKLGWSASR